jgi:hypothetical protein
MMEKEKAKLDSTLESRTQQQQRHDRLAAVRKWTCRLEMERTRERDVREVALELLLVPELPEAREAGVVAAAAAGVDGRHGGAAGRGLIPRHGLLRCHRAVCRSRQAARSHGEGDGELSAPAGRSAGT